MKSVMLGIMLVTVSASFAQTDGATHQLKNRFKAKQMMTVDRPAEMQITDNTKPKQTEVLSRNEVKSSFTNGVIRVINGVAYVDIEADRVDRRMKPVNLPKAAAIDGQEIQFRYIIVGQSKPNEMIIQLFDVAEVKE